MSKFIDDLFEFPDFQFPVMQPGLVPFDLRVHSLQLQVACFKLLVEIMIFLSQLQVLELYAALKVGHSNLILLTLSDSTN